MSSRVCEQSTKSNSLSPNCFQMSGEQMSATNHDSAVNCSGSSVIMPGRRPS